MPPVCRAAKTPMAKRNCSDIVNGRNQADGSFSSALIFRSLLFYAWYLPSGLLMALFCAIIGPLLPLVWRLSCVGYWQRSVIEWLRLTCRVRYSIEGMERIPAPPYVVISNHQSQWEAFCFQTLFHPLIMVVKRELLRVPVFGWGLAMLRPIAIQREEPRQAVRKIFVAGADRFRQGLSVLLFPEGTRMAPGSLGRYKRSSGELAAQNGVPLVPVVHNSGDCWPAHRFIKYPGVIRVVIGEPVLFDNQVQNRMSEIVKWTGMTLKKIREANP